jgi:uncharacterized membrane protein
MADRAVACLKAAAARSGVAALGGTVAGLILAMEYVDRRADTGGSAIDAAYTSPPDVPTVSGGPDSCIAWPSLSREGVRFVNLTLTRQEIADVTGVPVAGVKARVRVFAGLASGPTVDVRVDLVMEDLARLGAFDRSVLCVASPTGSFGESLGAHTLQDAFLYEGVSGLHRVGMDRALFIGTPAQQVGQEMAA